MFRHMFGDNYKSNMFVDEDQPFHFGHNKSEVTKNIYKFRNSMHSVTGKGRTAMTRAE